MRFNFRLLNIIFKIFLLVAIPAILVIQLNQYGILPIIAYFQFLLLWAQAEIGLKQHILFSAQFDPSFTISSIKITDNKIGDVGRRLIIKNTSKNPAYNLNVGRVLDKDNEPLMPRYWTNKILNKPSFDLSPEESAHLCDIMDLGLILNHAFEVNYQNQFGDFKDFRLFFHGDTPIMVPQPLKEPGILLNTFRDISLLPLVIRIKLKKY